jgi:hypothetical protein
VRKLKDFGRRKIRTDEPGMAAHHIIPATKGV